MICKMSKTEFLQSMILIGIFPFALLSIFILFPLFCYFLSSMLLAIKKITTFVPEIRDVHKERASDFFKCSYRLSQLLFIFMSRINLKVNTILSKTYYFKFFFVIQIHLFYTILENSSRKLLCRSKNLIQFKA